MTKSPWFDLARFEELRRARGVTWGRPVRAYEVTPSTSDLGLQAVTESDRTGIVWIAREQTKGRGRRGTSWIAPPGSALLMSTLLRWPAPAHTATGLGLAVGLAALRAAQPRVPQRELRLKWPNDVVCHGEKLAGVLVESRSDGRGGFGFVLGIGLNVTARSFAPEAGRATSLALLGASGEQLELESLLCDVLAQLERLVPRVLGGHLADVVAEVRKVDALDGRTVEVLDTVGGAPTTRGVARGISTRGELVVQTPSGDDHVASGHVIVV